MSEQERHDRSVGIRVDAALRAMPAQRRAVFLAVCAEEASYAAIGARVGMNVADVEREFAAALVELAAALDRRPSWCRRLLNRITGRADR